MGKKTQCGIVSNAHGEWGLPFTDVVEMAAHVIVARVARNGDAACALGAVAEGVVAVAVRCAVAGWTGEGFVDEGQAEAAINGDLKVVAWHEAVDG